MQGYEVDGPYASETVDIVRNHWSSIKTNASRRFNTNIYNIRIVNNDVRAALTGPLAMSIFHEQASVFKVNAAFGFLLVTDQNSVEPIKFWHPSGNRDRLFDSPQRISTLAEYRDFLEAISDQDLLEVITRERPDSSWRAHAITNLSIYTYRIREHCIGCPTDIPAHIRKNRAIVVADRDYQNQLRTDGLCFFRALSLSRKHSAVEEMTKEYSRRFIASQAEGTVYEGVQLSDLPQLERLFDISVTVYRMVTGGNGKHQAELVVRSGSTRKEVLNLHLQENHFCLITNIEMYCKNYKCQFCPKILKSMTLLNQHVASCSPGPTLIYPNGVYKPTEALFDRLAAAGIEVGESLRYYPFMAVFDCETYTDMSNIPKDTKTIQWVGRHRLACVSLCSNIAGNTEAICLVNREGEKATVNSLIDHLHRLSDVCETRLRLRYRGVFNRLEAKREELMELERRTSSDLGLEKIEARFQRLEEELDAFCRQLLIFTYNGGG